LVEKIQGILTFDVEGDLGVFYANHFDDGCGSAKVLQVIKLIERIM